MSQIKSIPAREFIKICHFDSQLIVIDVRSPSEFSRLHCMSAINVPLDQLDHDIKNNRFHSTNGKPIYVICGSGQRSKLACERLTRQGLTHVVNIEGGTSAFAAAGGALVRGKGTIALERQVRIAAGLLVLLGLGLGRFIDLRFAWISMFVGAGLVFAGVTDTCAMGLLIARMPWNKAQRTAV